MKIYFNIDAVYAATKAAVYSMTEALNVELYNKYNISCCDISVGYVATPMVHLQNRSDTWILSQTSQYLKPEDVAKIVDYAVHHVSCLFAELSRYSRYLIIYYIVPQTSRAFL